ncbi:MAG: hypothetical protein JJT89_00510 [Nitriliruptoraceae bacterium]|nr:hypothetical protein [Nitriliruptoraceae bacterium]
MAVIEGGNIIEGSELVGTYTVDGTPSNVAEEQTLAGVAHRGALLIDATNAVLYINTGTRAEPTWTVVGTQA